MSIRKVKDAKDLSSNELIYFKGHAKATYMSNGITVEDTINNIETEIESNLLDCAKKSDLANVATSGSYDDLTNKPTIPNAVSESTVSGWGFTKNTGTYIKPSTGIPKTDLASAVQTSLEKADTALQTETYKGTITGVSANGTSIATSGVANIPAASISAYGVTKLSSSTSSTSTSLAATASAVKSAYDLANGRQEKLVSGTNIKTINGQSLLGSGDIVISSGSSSGSVSGGSSSGAYSEVNHGTSDTTFALTPNTFHVWDEVTELNLDFGAETEGVANEYVFQFNSGSTATTLTLPDNIKWTDEFTIEVNKIYQISILNGLGSVLSWNNITKIKNVCTIITYENWGMVEYAIRFEYPVNSIIEFSIIDVNDEIIGTGYLDAGTQESSMPISDLNNVKTVMLNPSSDDIYLYVYETQVF